MTTSSATALLMAVFLLGLLLGAGLVLDGEAPMTAPLVHVMRVLVGVPT